MNKPCINSIKLTPSSNSFKIFLNGLKKDYRFVYLFDHLIQSITLKFKIKKREANICSINLIKISPTRFFP